MSSRALALLPATLLGILALWSGTLVSGAAAGATLISQALIVAIVLLAAARSGDPLALGPRARWLLPVGLLIVVLSWLSSPVRRAGLLPLVLLPAYLLLPAAAARCWPDPQHRRLGLSALALLHLLVSLLALALWQLQGSSRPALPLGHHNLLALWLVLLLPLVAGLIRRPGATRWLGLCATGSGLLAVVASRSLLAAAALGLQLTVAALVWRPLRGWLLAGAGLVSLVAAPRLAGVLALEDLSALARRAYGEAGLAGCLARPWLGWGPGSTPWTIAEFLSPQAETHPPSEIVGDLHNLPLQIAYEVGLIGLGVALVISALFLAQRWREAGREADPIVPRTAVIGLLGGLLFALGAAPLSIAALPATAAVVAGLALGIPPPVSSTPRRSPVLVYQLVATLVLAPACGAHMLYDRARAAPTGEAAHALLERAQELDPRFPLYRARQAWLTAALDPASTTTAAEAALAAARAAYASAPLWLAAGAIGHGVDAPWTQMALARAVRLDPLSPLAAFLLMQADPGAADSIELAVRSLTAQPRLADATWWREHPELAATVAARLDRPVGRPQPGAAATESQALALVVDRDAAASFSLYAFRRLPWPATIAAIRLEPH